LLSENAATIAATYFEAWKARDFATLRSILADDVEFVGPMAQLDNADDALKGLQGTAEMITDIVCTRGSSTVPTC
jgi:ketosteroid isomerase-like protein